MKIVTGIDVKKAGAVFEMAGYKTKGVLFSIGRYGVMFLYHVKTERSTDEQSKNSD